MSVIAPEEPRELSSSTVVPAQATAPESRTGTPGRTPQPPPAPSGTQAAHTDAHTDADLDALRGRRILVTAMNYAPEHTGCALYTTDLAEHLARVGARVTVLTTHPHYPRWRRPAGTRNIRTREVRRDVQVLRVPTYVPRNPSLLRRALYESSFLATATRDAATQHPDLVVTCTPALFAAALGATVARRFDVPLVTVCQDLVTAAADQSGMRGAGHAKTALTALERWVFRSSDHVTVPSGSFLHTVRDLAPETPVTVVPNWSRLPDVAADRETTRAALGWTGRFVVAHTGNMGLKQGLEELVPTLRHLARTRPEVLFSFVGGGSQQQTLVDAAGSLPNVEIRPPLPDADYLPGLRAADLLLVNERSTVRDMSLPSKLTSYFAAGQPVLAVVRDDSATAAEIRRSGGGVTVVPGSPEAFEATLDALRASPARRAALGARGRHHSVTRLSAEAGLRALASISAAVLTPHLPRRARPDAPVTKGALL